MYQITDNPDILIRLSDGASVARGTWLWPQEWLDAGNVPEPIHVPVPTTEELIAKAWSTADAICKAAADDNSRARYNAWLALGPEAQRIKIKAVIEWMDSIWQSYYMYKMNPVGEYIPPTTPCPYTFWDIANA